MRTSQNTEEEVASDGVGNNAGHKADHRKATVELLSSFGVGLHTVLFGVGRVDKHLRLFGPQILFAKLVSGGSH